MPRPPFIPAGAEPAERHPGREPVPHLRRLHPRAAGGDRARQRPPLASASRIRNAGGVEPLVDRAGCCAGGRRPRCARAAATRASCDGVRGRRPPTGVLLASARSASRRFTAITYCRPGGQREERTGRAAARAGAAPAGSAQGAAGHDGPRLAVKRHRLRPLEAGHVERQRRPRRRQARLLAG